MLRTDFHFDLPESLIAQVPLENRVASRLLQLEKQGDQIHDRVFAEVGELLRPGDLLVFNDTRVIPARLFGRKSSGGRVEVLIERVLDEHRVLAQMRSSKPSRQGTRLRLEDSFDAEVIARHDDLFELRFADEKPVLELLENYGRIPLPPYITREADTADRECYQTCYANAPGAVAAPTAGLHFTPALMQQLADRGIQQGFVTLHVGAGTFQPVRAERVEDHRLHSERIEVNAELVEQIARVKAAGGRVVAVGTTTVRSLESAARQSVSAAELQPFHGESDIFIYPGYEFQVVDALITNFHLPESSLLMLVSAFAGQERILAAYRHAVQQSYRFFSYGDAMFLERSE